MYKASSFHNLNSKNNDKRYLKYDNLTDSNTKDYLKQVTDLYKQLETYTKITVHFRDLAN